MGCINSMPGGGRGKRAKASSKIEEGESATSSGDGDSISGYIMKKRIAKESQIGLQLDHPHLIEFRGVLEIPGRGMALVLELATGGSLRKLLIPCSAKTISFFRAKTCADSHSTV